MNPLDEIHAVSFDRFEIEMSLRAVKECSHSGQCDGDVENWQSQIVRPKECTSDRLRAELDEYGAWEDFQLADDAQNWRRIVWLAAGRIKYEIYETTRQRI